MRKIPAKVKQLPAPIVVDPTVGKRRRRRVNSQIEEAEKAISFFNSKSKHIVKLIDAKDNDSTASETQRSLLSMMVQLIPIAEQNYKTYRTERAAYALNSLVSQVRELLSDLQSTNDRSVVIENILYNVIEPTLRQYAQYLIDSNLELKQKLEVCVPKSQQSEMREIIDIDTKKNAAFLQSIFATLKERIATQLSE